MIPNIGPLEIAIVLIIALIVFGPKRLPELGSSLGGGMREFAQGIKGGGKTLEKAEAPVEVADSEEKSGTAV
jgi:sec-independent protein translocase protein TatA